METHFIDPAREIKRLQRCLDDLVSVLALPRMRTGHESLEILSTFANFLLEVLDLDFLYARVRVEANSAPIELLNIDKSRRPNQDRNKLTQALNRWLSENQVDSLAEIQKHFEGEDISIFRIQLEMEIKSGLGEVVAGARRSGFPQQTERLVLAAAADQVAIGLQYARMLSEQKRVARELYDRVTQKTRELAAANEQLKKAESESRLILDNIPGLIVLLSANGDLETANRQTFEYFGQPLEVLRHWSTNGMIHPEDLPQFSEVFSSSIMTGSPYEIVLRIKRSDGVYRWFQNRGFPVHDENGNVIRWYGLITDVHGQKRAEEALRESEAFLLDAQQLSHTGSWKHDFVSSIVSSTPEIDRIFAITPEDNRAAVDFFFNRIHPEDREGEALMYERALSDKLDFESDYRIVLPDGSIKYIHNTGRPQVNKVGEVVGFVGTAIDLTEQHKNRVDLEKALAEVKKSEAKLWRVIDTIPTLSWCNLPDGSNEFLSKGWHEYTGLSAEEANGWGWQAVFHPEDLPQFMERWKELLVSGEPGEIEARLRRSDGICRWFLIRVSPFRDESGGIARWYGTSTDIHDRKRAEEALRESENHLRLIVDTIPGLVCTLKANWEVECVNQQTRDYFGMTLDDLKGWEFIGVVHPDDLERVVAKCRHSAETGEPYDIEHRCRRSDGVFRWFQVRAMPFRDVVGHIVQWYLLLTDIEDRKRAEEAVRTSEENLRLIINTMPVLAWSARPDGQVDFFNRRWLNYTGLSSTQAEGWRWTQAMHPEDLDRVAAYWQSITSGGESGEIEARLRRFDGSYRWFLFRADPLRDESGAIVKWYGTNTDIEDRKRAEEELRRKEAFLTKAQRLSATGSFSWCLDTDEITFSEETYRIFGFEPNAVVTFELMATRIHPEDLPLLAERSEAARRTGESHDYEIRLLMPDGSLKYLHTNSNEARDLSGRREYIGAIQDVTQRRLAKESLNNARSELAHMSRVTSLSVLTASIAHEINQPLSGIITNASTCLRMLDANPPNLDGARETARRTMRDGNRAADVITRLRTLFSKKEVATEHVDLNEATREVVALLLSELQRNGAILHYEFAKYLPIVEGDRIQLQQVILNLIRNASDAMSRIEDRSRRLLIRTEQVDGDVCVTVQDSGAGFDPAIADRLFESFYTTKKDGMGIGLWVSRSIIEAHGGRVWAKTNDEPGATFSFSVPCQHSS
jgi:PAS domain S-box-containing protein